MLKHLLGSLAIMAFIAMVTAPAIAGNVDAERYCSFGYGGTKCEISVFYSPTFSPGEETTFTISCRGDNSSLVSVYLKENSEPEKINCTAELGTMDADYPTAGAYQQYVCKRTAAAQGDVSVRLRWSGTCNKF